VSAASFFFVVCRFLRKACAWKSHIILGFEKKENFKQQQQQRLVLKSSSPKQKK